MKEDATSNQDREEALFALRELLTFIERELVEPGASGTPWSILPNKAKALRAELSRTKSALAATCSDLAVAMSRIESLTAEADDLRVALRDRESVDARRLVNIEALAKKHDDLEARIAAIAIERDVARSVNRVLKERCTRLAAVVLEMAAERLAIAADPSIARAARGLARSVRQSAQLVRGRVREMTNAWLVAQIVARGAR